MSLRTTIHSAAGLAAIILLFSTPSTKSPRFEIAASISLMVLIVYLIWVLVVIFLDNFRRPPIYNGALWDQEIDDFPDLNHPGRKLEFEEESPTLVD